MLVPLPLPLRPVRLRPAATAPRGGGVVVIVTTSPPLLLLLLLQRVLLPLSLPTPNALRRQSLVTECRPRAKVLASLAPFDLEARGGYDPHVDVAYRAQALVLGGDVGVRASAVRRCRGRGGVGVVVVGAAVLVGVISRVFAQGCHGGAAAGTAIGRSGLGRRRLRPAVLTARLLALVPHAARTRLSAHDATSHPLGNIGTGLAIHVSRKVHEVVKIRYGRILVFFDISLKLGGYGRLDRHALALRSRHCAAVRPPSRSVGHVEMMRHEVGRVPSSSPSSSQLALSLLFFLSLSRLFLPRLSTLSASLSQLREKSLTSWLSYLYESSPPEPLACRAVRSNPVRKRRSGCSTKRKP
mmetsp:Transcript_10517/g.25862  ORF Transcript_10517/g.25862 Transcript_10517/m.25862 type:complete len:355 (+) Transcript_10517:446-1510(+)